jgi:DNA-binding transcriptional ArsR family regulator
LVGKDGVDAIHATVIKKRSFARELFERYLAEETFSFSPVEYIAIHRRLFGFDVANDIFAAHVWYFRNALVRANYNDLAHGIHATQEYLNRFFGNLILGENNVLKNRELLALSEAVASANVGVNVGVKSAVLAQLKERPDLSAKELATLLGKTPRTVERHIKALREQGLLIRVGADKGGHWEVREGLR